MTKPTLVETPGCVRFFEAAIYVAVVLFMMAGAMFAAIVGSFVVAEAGYGAAAWFMRWVVTPVVPIGIWLNLWAYNRAKRQGSVP